MKNRRHADAGGVDNIDSLQMRIREEYIDVDEYRRAAPLYSSCAGELRAIRY